MPVSIAERSKACSVYDRLNIEITVSNPLRGVDVSACVCVVLSCVSVEALRWTDSPTKESYQMSVDRESIKGSQVPIRTVVASWKKIV
jgi:hypothetical protein